MNEKSATGGRGHPLNRGQQSHAAACSGLSGATEKPANSAGKSPSSLSVGIAGAPRPDATRNLRLMARLSSLAYLQPDVAQFAARACQASVVVVEDKGTDTQAHIWTIQDATIIAFRGTSSIRDGITDASVRLVDSDFGGRIHAGFCRALNAVYWDRPLDALVDKPNLWFTGHSLGGALAALAAQWTAASQFPVAGCVTFGQPRVGNSDWASIADSQLADRYVRVVNDLDIVPRLPWLLGRYRHAGTELFYDRDRRLTINPSPWFKLWSCISFLPHQIAYRWDDLLDDHALDEYEQLAGPTASERLKAKQ